MEANLARRQIMVRVSAETYKQIVSLAEKEQRSVSSLTGILLQRALALRQPPRQPQKEQDA